MTNSTKLLFTFLFFAHVAFLCAALDYNTQTTATTETFWSIDCCDIVHKLTLYAVEDSGDKGCPQPCLELQVIKLFVRHTQSMLSQPTGIDAFAVQTNASTSNILINPESLQRHSATLLVLALLGTASLPDNKQHERISYTFAELSTFSSMTIFLTKFYNIATKLYKSSSPECSQTSHEREKLLAAAQKIEKTTGIYRRPCKGEDISSLGTLVAVQLIMTAQLQNTYENPFLGILTLVFGIRCFLKFLNYTLIYSVCERSKKNNKILAQKFIFLSIDTITLTFIFELAVRISASSDMEYASTATGMLIIIVFGGTFLYTVIETHERCKMMKE
jgi:hypothetical protein